MFSALLPFVYCFIPNPLNMMTFGQVFLLKLSLISKCRITIIITLMWFVLSMHIQNVILKVELCFCNIVALITLKSLYFTIMHCSDVSLQIHMGKGLVAYGTGSRLRSRQFLLDFFSPMIGIDMQSQQSLRCKCLFTFFTIVTF